MPLPTMNVLDKDGASQTIYKINSGRQAAADSQAVALDNESKASLDAAAAALGAPADAAWTGSGSAAAIALLKALAGQALNTNPVSVRGNLRKVDFTPALDTVAYANGDVLIATGLISSFFSNADVPAILQDMVIVDGADASLMAIDLYFLDANKSIGTINGVPSISDADAESIIGSVRVEVTDWRDLGGVKVANVKNIGLQLHPVTGTANIYVAAVITALGSAVTYNTAGTPPTRLQFRFKLQD